MLAALNRPSRLVHAQAAAYEIISFGPITTEVQIKYDWGTSAQAGDVRGIHSSGVAFGRIAASEEKFTPTLFHPDGSVTKLKSGEFGGDINGMNSKGHAVGMAYDFIGGEEPSDSEKDGARPALWIDGELTRLPMPDSTPVQGAKPGGYAIAISDTGVIFGRAYGQDVLWVDGQLQVLSGNSDYGHLSYQALTPDGTLIAETSTYSAEINNYAYRRGPVRDGVFTPFDLPEELDLLGGATLVNSANDVLYGLLDDDYMLRKTAIVSADGHVELTDFGDDGIDFYPAGFNADHEIVGAWTGEAALMRGEDIVNLNTLLPSNGFAFISVKGISDGGIIAAEAQGMGNSYFPLLLIPA